MDDKKDPRSETTKAVWEAPTIEEIDYAQTEGERRTRIAAEELQILVTLAGKLQQELIDVRLQDRRKQEVVVALP